MEEQSLVNLYESVMSKEYEDLNWVDIVLSMNEIRKAYRKIDSSAPISTIDYNSNSYRFAYIYLYAVCHTATMREMMKMLESNQMSTFLQMMAFGKDLNVCCLGGGPGCEMIGFLCGLNRSLCSTLFSDQRNISFTVLDTCSGWSISLKHVLEAFLKSDLGRNYTSNFTCNFEQANLCSFLHAEALYPIMNANIITMVKFVSVVSHCYKNNSYYLQVILKLMKPGSFLLFLDNRTGGFFEIVSEIASENNLVLLYRCNAVYQHNGDIQFQKYIFQPDPLRISKVTFAVWKKKEMNTCVCL
ncbi:uncharacterized protein LOC111627684 [Centruroides sculpturatus]|uniref:uncharacterized protein LOC111627684 n=1 Tax=Centruroides sculpturatus TaxID=218467 RepID=UPI000C6EE97D|nr:uncharacterized protein LOC111627684 [Centruroides sculpturatus]